MRTITTHPRLGIHFMKNDCSSSWIQPLNALQGIHVQETEQQKPDTTQRVFMLTNHLVNTRLSAIALSLDTQVEYTATPRELIESINRHKWGIVLVSFRGSERTATQAHPIWNVLAGLRENNITIPVVVEAENLSTNDVVNLMKAGVHDVLLESSTPNLCKKSLTKAFSTGTECWKRWKATQQFRNLWNLLTTREMEVTQYVLRGWASRDIAGSMNVSLKTIETHRANVLRKTQTKGTMDLYRQALGAGLIDAEIHASDPVEQN